MTPRNKILQHGFMAPKILKHLDRLKDPKLPRAQAVTATQLATVFNRDYMTVIRCLRRLRAAGLVHSRPAAQFPEVQPSVANQNAWFLGPDPDAQASDVVADDFTVVERRVMARLPELTG